MSPNIIREVLFLLSVCMNLLLVDCGYTSVFGMFSTWYSFFVGFFVALETILDGWVRLNAEVYCVE